MEMEYIYVLNASRERITVVDTFVSLIWTKRYNEPGDFELYVPATPELLSYMQLGNFIERPDDDMLGVIEKVTLDTNADAGDYLTVTGRDATSFLARRVVWKTTSTQNGHVEIFVKRVVREAFAAATVPQRVINGETIDSYTDSDRVVTYIMTAPTSGLAARLTTSFKYVNVLERVQEILKAAGYGCKMTRSGTDLVFDVYAGTDRRDSVIFSDEYGNLVSSTYQIDGTEINNVALIGGSGTGSRRFLEYAYPTAETGISRHELWIDDKDESSTITYAELVAEWPNGYQYTVGSRRTYHYDIFDVPIFDAQQLARVEAQYASQGTAIVIDGQLYYRITDLDIALLPASGTITDDTNVTLLYAGYSGVLVADGYAKLREGKLAATTAFTGEIELRGSPFQYRTDFDLGDIVTIASRYGFHAAARIIGVVEVRNENGYLVQPVFEYV